jgi:type IV fimbrial biogenesis protein FimT
LNSRKSCFNEWQEAVTIFSDKNKNLRLDPEDKQLLNLPKPSDGSLVTYPRTAIVFDHRGFSGGYNGSLSYCKASADVGSIGMSIIISRVGRIRFGADTNSNGLPELANGDDVPCKQYH